MCSDLLSPSPLASAVLFKDLPVAHDQPLQYAVPVTYVFFFWQHT